MRRVEQALDRLLDRGVLPLLPNYVRRLYMDGGRLPISRRPGDTYVPRARMWRPRGLIGSPAPALNPHPISDERVSRVQPPRWPLKITPAQRRSGEGLPRSPAVARYGPHFAI